jgi:bifunctional DNA-binding transcriptional regulator/antitoxin component of YhaV-PrlF toxin-antitoxin module
MSNTSITQLTQQGTITLPNSLRNKYSLRPGDTLTILDLGGLFLLKPGHSEIDELAGRITHALVEEGETQETMLQALREERERYIG